ncbi:MAG: hypothetical protein K9H64_11770 [Bacteroidales bacterium]|nr:hypothetical protein [Bacteroidales bacterium]MCF8456658.1 hypothetical protein [Bacteroidales bacterium]
MKSINFETTELMHHSSANRSREAYETSLLGHAHFKNVLEEQERSNKDTSTYYHISPIHDLDIDFFISVPQY